MSDQGESASLEPTVIPTKSISSTSIDADALKVVRRLQRFGHTAYLVGGCVRDLMLKRTPKDFDVVTSARPAQVRKLFRNCRLIGRRFRLAHIHFRGKIIETATFRGQADNQDGSLLIRSDNVFGTESEDAKRRDFTVNALFYDPVEKLIIDYVGGLEDLVERTLRFIGSPEVRVQEDPVRMLRAVKFAARLGFTIEADTWQAIIDFREELLKSAPPRILEEILRMLRSGAAEKSFRLMWESGLLGVVLPEVACYLSRSILRDEERDPGAGLWSYLKALDKDARDMETNAVLMAALLIHPVEDAVHGHCADEYGLKTKSGATGEIALEMLRNMVARIRLPKKDVERIQQLLVSQRKLLALRRNYPLPRNLMRRAYFPEALDLFEIGVRATRKGRRVLNRLRGAFRQRAFSHRKNSKPGKKARGRIRKKTSSSSIRRGKKVKKDLSSVPKKKPPSE